MTRERGHQALASRIAAHLRQRGEPCPSRLLAEQFLRLAAGSEDAATALLRPALEQAGLTYARGRGWLPPAVAGAPAEPRFVVAAAPAGCGPVLLEAATGEPAGADLESATIVVLDRADGARLRRWAIARKVARSLDITTLRGVVRGCVRIPRAATLEEICSALGVRWHEGDDPVIVARAMAACVLETAARRAASRHMESGSAEPQLPEGITRAGIDALPESPGIYRFYDEAGSLIYVGKAANLRRRVASYFQASAGRRPRRFYGRIHHLDHQVAATELEALLAEARWIHRKSPPGNVQLELHERAGRYGEARAFALLLPAASGRSVTALFVRDGRVLGRTRVGRRGGGTGKVRRLLELAAGLRRETPAMAPDRRRDTAILRSWLGRRRDAVSRVDLDSCAGTHEAAALLATAVKQLLADPHAAVFRGTSDPSPPSSSRA